MLQYAAFRILKAQLLHLVYMFLALQRLRLHGITAYLRCRCSYNAGFRRVKIALLKISVLVNKVNLSVPNA